MDISPNMSRKISNAMRQYRLANKAAENHGKPPLDSNDIVQTADFTFSPISPLGCAGDSGQLLLAKSKANRRIRYLVKHAFTDCACNEFIYTKLAQAMGYRMPDTVLFQISSGEKRHYFKTEYIIGARYLNLVNQFPSYSEIREQAKNWQDYFGFCALYAMTGECDGLETPIADDGFLYRVDTTGAFPLGNWQLDLLGINEAIDGVNPHEYFKHRLLSQNFDGIMCQSSCDFWLEGCMKLNNECLYSFLEPFVRIQEIRPAYIDDFLNTLCYLYPDCIGEYFKRYISALKIQAAEYLKSRR